MVLLVVIEYLQIEQSLKHPQIGLDHSPDMVKLLRNLQYSLLYTKTERGTLSHSSSDSEVTSLSYHKLTHPTQRPTRAKLQI
jgi:hypothetical protein